MTQTIAEIAAGLSEAQRGWIADAWPIDDDDGDHVVMDDGAEPLSPAIAHPVSGRLTPLGIQLRDFLREKEAGRG